MVTKESGYKKGFALFPTNQTNSLAKEMNRSKEAVSLVEEAYQIATEHNFNALVKQFKPILENIRTKVD